MIPKREWLACGLVFAAVTFNMVLCFLNALSEELAQTKPVRKSNAPA